MNPVTIQTALGALRGVAQGGIARFHAVPYAQPPVGALRLAPPQPAQAWQGVRDATCPGPISLQHPSRLSNVMGEPERRVQSEDCLTVTVWTPAADTQRRPVIVWLHGGAYMTGGGDLDWYDGARMARSGDVVVVAVNYRLGALGFLRLNGLTPGNLGLMDQELAVRWVHQHIGAFGGDPDQITLMGQSAGGLSIGLLLGSATLAPVRRAIMMSAPLGLRLASPQQAERVGEAYVRALGIDPQAADMAEQVRQVPESALLPAQAAAAVFFRDQLSAPGDITPPFTPVADGNLAPLDLHTQRALDAAAARCDVLIGTTRDEAAAFHPDSWEPALTAGTFERPSIRWAVQAATAGRAAYLYRLDWSPEGSPFGAAHCIDLPLAFDTVGAFAAAPMLHGATASDLDSLASLMHTSWCHFARHGRPTPVGPAGWPPCTPTQAPRLHIGREPSVALAETAVL